MLNFFISPIGTFSTIGKSVCNACQIGYFSTKTGSKNCNICSNCPPSVEPPQCLNNNTLIKKKISNRIEAKSLFSMINYQKIKVN